jgi:hypothetical protein
MSVASTNYNRVKEKLTFHILTFCHPTMSIPNTRPDSFLRAGGMLKEGSRERIEDWIIMMRLYPPSTAEFISWSLQSHLVISGPPPQLKPGEEYFSPRRQRKPCIHSSPVVVNQELVSRRISR